MKENRIIGLAALALIAYLAVGVAQAQTTTRVTNCSAATPNNALCLEWTHDGKAIDGTAVTGVTYRVQQRASTATSFSTIASNLTVLKLYVENLAPGDYTFRVYANCTGAGCVESAASNVAGKTVAPPTVQPSAPVLIIAATIRADGPPTYRVIQTVTLRPNEVVFVAASAMKPLFRNSP